MSFHRVGTDPHFFCYYMGGMAFGHQVQHFKFLWRKHCAMKMVQDGLGVLTNP